jgi:hypothetical protein
MSSGRERLTRTTMLRPGYLTSHLFLFSESYIINVTDKTQIKSIRKFREFVCINDENVSKFRFDFDVDRLQELIHLPS